MQNERDVDMVWAMLSCYEPLEKMAEMSGLSEEKILEIARENAFDFSYLFD